MICRLSDVCHAVLGKRLDTPNCGNTTRLDYTTSPVLYVQKQPSGVSTPSSGYNLILYNAGKTKPKRSPSSNTGRRLAALLRVRTGHTANCRYSVVTGLAVASVLCGLGMHSTLHVLRTYSTLEGRIQDSVDIITHMGRKEKIVQYAPRPC